MLVLAAALLLPQSPDFARDVLPILSENCLSCHGPDEKSRKAKLRLDVESSARRVLDGELLRRLTTDDAGDRMPPPKSGKQLSAAQVATIRQWIEGGAKWGRHWAFVPPTRPKTPRIHSDWPKNAIDQFALSKMQLAGAQPSPEADRRTLLRRVSFDLTGLPPTTEELERFLADDKPGAYARLVDRLLASPHYGERMAMVWLDAARYADTDGYQVDATRRNWPWRDWVVDAYNANMPFDRFTIEQFAGDLLPKATAAQKLATCFHRNNMTNGEGGRHREESRVDYVIDRVNTIGTVWLGLTLGCAQCHDHKYDPISQRDYYSLSAFFNSIAEDGTAGPGAGPHLPYRSTRVAPGKAAAQRWLAECTNELKAAERAAEPAFARWLAARHAVAKRHRSWLPMRTARLRATHGATLAMDKGDGTITARGTNARHDDYVLATRPPLERVTAMRLTVLPVDGKLSRSSDGHFILTNVKVAIRTKSRAELVSVKIRKATADHQAKKAQSKNYGPVRDVLDDDPRTGWFTAGRSPAEARTALFAFDEPLRLAADQELVIELHHRSLRGRSNIRSFRIEFTADAGPATTRLGPTPMERLATATNLAKLGRADREALRQEYLADDAPVRAARATVASARKRLRDYTAAEKPQKVQVLARRKKARRTWVLQRGIWNKHGAEVREDVPAALGAWPKDLPRTRTGLAKWLVGGDHPLTARVAVNRYWQMYFGQGLVRTPEDFGLQGEHPTHPQLLDWLAREFVASGWDIKHIQRLIVTSATYRQSSVMTKLHRETDPQNRLLSRASSFRLPSAMIRDAALRASGLLATRLGGPPVFPYQPPGVWAASTMGRFSYAHSVGDDLYRRSLYSFWRRMVAPTGMFDASKRRTCQVRVVRTNTPLHALTLLNGTTYVEAARVLAEDLVRRHASDTDRIRAAMLRIVSRPPDRAELARLRRSVARTREHFAADHDAARRWLRTGPHRPDPKLDPVEVATFAVLASTLLNLDEAITHR